MKLTAVLPLLVGLIIGIAVTAAYLSWRHSDSKAEFSAKLKCQEVAKDYASANQSVTVEEVAYSEKRNSCVAKVLESKRDEQITEVIDLLSGRMLWGSSCNDKPETKNWCGNGRDIAIMSEADKQFVKIVNSRGEY